MNGRHLIALVAGTLVLACVASNPNAGSVTPRVAAAGASKVVATTATAPSEPPVPAGAAPLVDRARQNLQARRMVAHPGEIRVLSVQAVDWPDAGLDCPDPEARVRPATTPGYRIDLEAAGRRFEYHTDTAYSIVLCSEGQPARVRR
ncbi:MAG: hypothetical protein HY907_07700 [Deltaproteobacteria bacterium]|nr:hypothetical protein [Deltaproteobacteria bacterium]